MTKKNFLCLFCNKQLNFFKNNSNNDFLILFNYRCNCKFKYKCWLHVNKNGIPTFNKIYSYKLGKYEVNYFFRSKELFIYKNYNQYKIGDYEEVVFSMEKKKENKIPIFRSVQEIENFLIIQ